MKKNLSFTFLIGFMTLTNSSMLGFVDKRRVYGTMQFPQSIEAIPADLRVYHSGNKIKIECDSKTRRLTFSLLIERHQTHFFLLITEQFQNVIDCDNTVKYLKINPEKPYKLYLLQQISERGNMWDIKEQALPSGRIPDAAVIVCYPPEYIEGLCGGTNIELPKIVVLENILDIVGSEAVLHDRSHKIVLTCLDYDAIHSPRTTSIKQANHLTTIIALDT